MIVIDASALVELVVGGTPRAARLAARVAGSAESLHAPYLIDLEVTSVLRSLEARRMVSRAVATRAIGDLLALDVTRYPHDVLVPRIWQLRGNLTAYDAAYVALAESLRAPLVTCDGQLAAAPGNRANIELFA
ncbi:MAG TPA: type II toxin-antitoxin system VapC family toxin [Kofleriaceae bacterium]|jgi:predicted nucleic acid-binding protein|nr:type II toxin-antitoxin system VapC family toxin [Kofleriaceae bacterium]